MYTKSGNNPLQNRKILDSFSLLLLYTGFTLKFHFSSKNRMWFPYTHSQSDSVQITGLKKGMLQIYIFHGRFYCSDIIHFFLVLPFIIIKLWLTLPERLLGSSCGLSNLEANVEQVVWKYKLLPPPSPLLGFDLFSG